MKTFIFRHLQIFSQNEFFRGITLPVPPTIETLESKMPPRILQNPFAIDFLKVTFAIKFFLPPESYETKLIKLFALKLYLKIENSFYL